jgi:hypothetical protein
MTEMDFLKAEYSDLHKDVLGCRPRNYEEMAQWTDEQWQEEYNKLIVLLQAGE